MFTPEESKVLAIIRANPGIGTDDLRRACDLPAGTVRAAISVLLSDRKITASKSSGGRGRPKVSYVA